MDGKIGMSALDHAWLCVLEIGGAVAAWVSEGTAWGGTVAVVRCTAATSSAVAARDAAFADHA